MLLEIKSRATDANVSFEVEANSSASLLSVWVDVVVVEVAAVDDSIGCEDSNCPLDCKLHYSESR